MALLTPQLIERLNAQQQSFGEAPAVVDIGGHSPAAEPPISSSSNLEKESQQTPPVESSSTDKKKQRSKKKKKEHLEYYAYSAFQISPDPNTLPLPRFISK